MVSSIIGIYVLAIMVGILGGMKIGESVGNQVANDQRQRIITLQEEMLGELEHQTQLLITLEDNPVILQEQHD